MEKIIVNNKKFNLEESKKNHLIYQYCYKKGIEIPCFCYNENLEIAGNCRICLVEVSTSPKLVLSCATKVEKNMVVKTKTKRLKRVRQSIIEFLLINHPLDCPICDQGGECDLQNITQTYGLDRGRFYEFSKRSVLDKESGFFIKTIMTRCIHCTRCVRFFKEIEGIAGFGIIGRGEETEIVLRKENLLSILSGNVVDICPVGALTSKVYTFTARPWELNKYENIDILDSMCSSINLDLRNNKILRILPVSDSILNQDWITNITRYFFDGLSVQRLVKPFLIVKGTFLDLSWSSITKILLNRLLSNLVANKGISFILFDFIDLESLSYLKKFNLNLGILNINLIKKFYNNSDFNFNYFFNVDSLNLINYYYYFFLILNLRLKMPLLNTRLRSNLKKKDLKMFSVGFVSFDISFNMVNLGNNFETILNLLENKSKFNLSYFYNSFFINKFFNILNSKNLALLVGEDFFLFKKAYKILNRFCLHFLITNSDIFCLFTNTLDLNLQHLNLNNSKNFLQELNSNFIYSFYAFSNKDISKKKNNFSVLQNSYFSNNLKNYNLILPVSNFFEYNGSFLNFEGRLRKKLKVYSYNNLKLKSNNDILKYLNIVLNMSLNFLNFDFKLLKFFYNFIFINYEIYLNKNIIKISNVNYSYYNMHFFNFRIFDNLVNVYKYKNLYRNSFSLNKASIYLNTYLNTYAI